MAFRNSCFRGLLGKVVGHTGPVFRVNVGSRVIGRFKRVLSYTETRGSKFRTILTKVAVRAVNLVCSVGGGRSCKSISVRGVRRTYMLVQRGVCSGFAPRSVTRSVGVDCSGFEGSFGRCAKVTPRRCVLRLGLDGVGSLLDDARVSVRSVTVGLGFRSTSCFSCFFEDGANVGPLSCQGRVRGRQRGTGGGSRWGGPSVEGPIRACTVTILPFPPGGTGSGEWGQEGGKWSGLKLRLSYLPRWKPVPYFLSRTFHQRPSTQGEKQRTQLVCSRTPGSLTPGNLCISESGKQRRSSVICTHVPWDFRKRPSFQRVAKRKSFRPSCLPAAGGHLRPHPMAGLNAKSRAGGRAERPVSSTISLSSFRRTQRSKVRACRSSSDFIPANFCVSCHTQFRLCP